MAYHEKNTKIFLLERPHHEKNQRHTHPYIATQFEANSIGLHIELHSSFIQFSLPFYLFQYAELEVYGKKLEQGEFEMQDINKNMYMWRQTEWEKMRDSTLSAALMKKKEKKIDDQSM